MYMYVCRYTHSLYMYMALAYQLTCAKNSFVEGFLLNKSQQLMGVGQQSGRYTNTTTHIHM